VNVQTKFKLSRPFSQYICKPTYHKIYTIFTHHFKFICFDFSTSMNWRSIYIPTVKSCSAGFTYRLDRLKPGASTFRGPPAKVYVVFNTVIWISHLCFNNVLYFLNNPSVIFLTQLHSISEYCRILNTPYHLRLYWNWLDILPYSPSREGGELGGASQVE
jgi:hypothetical protein